MSEVDSRVITLQSIDEKRENYCHLDYCSVIWASASKTDLNKLETVQNRAARLALDRSYRSNVNPMHSDLKWPKVLDRLPIRSLIFIKNVISTHVPSLFNEIGFCSDAYSYGTRSATAGHIYLFVYNCCFVSIILSLLLLLYLNECDC